MNSVPNLSINELFYKYKGCSIFSLNIPKGYYSFRQPLGIYGLSGSGKSTLGKILAGLITPLKGNVDFTFNSNEFSESQKNPSVLYSTQFPERVFLGYRVRETIDYINSKNLSLNDFKSNVISLLGQFSLDYEDIKDKSGYEMSGGELRRFALSLSFAYLSDVLILDEPTIGLGGRGREQLCNVLKHFSRNRAIIVISHDFKLVSSICTYIWILRSGKVIFRGSLNEMRNSDSVTDKAGLGFYRQLEEMVKEKFEIFKAKS